MDVREASSFLFVSGHGPLDLCGGDCVDCHH